MLIANNRGGGYQLPIGVALWFQNLDKKIWSCKFEGWCSALCQKLKF